MSWFRQEDGRLILSVHAQPGAKRTAIHGLHGGALKIRVAAAPVDGAANEELRRFLARSFAVLLRDVDLISGQSSRTKRFAIHGSKVDPHTLCNINS